MSKFDIDWGNVEETLLIITFNTGWNFKDYTDGLHELKSIALSKNHKVNLFFDFQMTKSVPRDLPSMMKHGQNFLIDNSGIIVLISPSSVWTKLYRSFQYLLPSGIKIQFAPNTDVAYQLLKDAVS